MSKNLVLILLHKHIPNNPTYGNNVSAVTYSNLARNVKKEDGINKYYMSSKLTFVNSEVNKVNLYLIYIDKNGNFSVNEELTDKININDSSYWSSLINFRIYDCKNLKFHISLFICYIYSLTLLFLFFKGTKKPLHNSEMKN